MVCRCTINARKLIDISESDERIDVRCTSNPFIFQANIETTTGRKHIKFDYIELNVQNTI